jgi:hypothetical protein
LFTTVTTVPKGSVGLAHVPDGAAEYQVASPTSLFAATTRGGAVVVVVVGGGAVVVVVVVVVGGGVGGGGGTVVGVTAGGDGVVVDGAGAVVVVVVVVAGAWYATRCDARFTPSGLVAPRTDSACLGTSRAVASDRDACAVAFCNNRRGAPNNTPQMIAATPRRLPPVLWFRRAPPFFGDTVHPRRHTGGEGFLENLDNRLQATQTRNGAETFCGLFSQVTALGLRDI